MRQSPPTPRSDIQTDDRRGSSVRHQRLRVFWLCLALGLPAVILLVWLFGLTWWSILITALVIACPAVMAWLLLGGLDAPEPSQRTDR
jgi:hypothetical protein